MRDIYSERSGQKVSGNVCKRRMPEDWTGGCDGDEEHGTRYYEVNRGMNTIISRMLMNGYCNKRKAAHITHGTIWGINSDDVLTSVMTGYDSATPSGGGTRRNPEHK